jgi:glycosyltransferase involved in cell wall biosynthesis
MGEPPAARSRPITFLTSTKAWGGIERCWVNLSNELVQRGYCVDLAITRDGEIPYPDQLDDRVRIEYLKARQPLRAAVQVARYARRRNPLGLIVPKYQDAFTALSARRWLAMSTPLYLSIRSTLSHSAGKRLRRRRKMRRRYDRADRIIAISRGVADDLVDNFSIDRGKVTAIYNPTLNRDVDTRAAAPVDHPWLTTTPRPEPVVISAGRLVATKDFSLLIRAVARVRERRPCRLIILGEGSQRSELEALARSLGVAEAVDLPGWVADPLPAMARADLFAMSSKHEGLGNVLVEALAAGVPAVSTDCPSGPREILQDGRLGPLTPPGDAEALAQAIRQTLDAPPDRQTLRDGAAPFFTDQAADQYLRVMGLEPTP